MKQQYHFITIYIPPYSKAKACNLVLEILNTVTQNITLLKGIEMHYTLN